MSAAGGMTEEQASIKIEAVARGKQDRKKVQKMREEKKLAEEKKKLAEEKGGDSSGDTNGNDAAASAADVGGTMTEEQAAVKIEAMQRGKQDRAKVKKMKEDKAAEAKLALEAGKAAETTETTETATETTETTETTKTTETTETTETKLALEAKKKKERPETTPEQPTTLTTKPSVERRQQFKKISTPTRPAIKKSIVNRPSPRVLANKKKAKEQAEAEEKKRIERFEADTAELSARFFKEITEGTIYVPSEFYPDINSAVARAKDSSGGIKTIKIAEGTFDLTQKHHAGFNCCVLDFPIQMIGEGATKTVIVGMFELISNGKASADKNGSLIYEGLGIVLTNLGITNPTDKHKKTTEQPTTRGIWSDRGLPLTMNNCEVTMCKGDGLYVRGGSYVRMNRCKVHKNKCQGVFLSGAGTRACLVDIEACNNGDSAIYVNRGADIDLRGFRTNIHHNGMYKENRYGIKASGTDSEIVIYWPPSHEFLFENGYHVYITTCSVDNEETLKGYYERSPTAKNMAEEFNGNITYAKLTPRQLQSYDNFLNRGNAEMQEKMRKLSAQGFASFPADFSNMTNAISFAKRSKGKIKEIHLSSGIIDFQGEDCHVSFPISLQGPSDGGKAEVVGEFVIEGDLNSKAEVVLENLIINAPEGYPLLNEGGMPVRLVNCTISKSSETALHVSNGSKITMERCHVFDCAHDGIYVEGKGSQAVLVDCHIHNIDGGAAVVAADGASVTIDGSETNIHDCFTGVHAEDPGSRVDINLNYDVNTCHDNRKDRNLYETKGGTVVYSDSQEETKRREAEK